LIMAGNPDLAATSTAKTDFAARLRTILTTNAPTLNLPTVTVGGVTSVDPAFIASIVRDALVGVS
jgi:hypothetical protein